VAGAGIGEDPDVPVGAGEQAELFPDADVRPIPEDLGYRGTVVCSVVGITYRQLDYWARTELVVPSIRPATGSGSQRLYSFRDVLLLRIVKRLLDTGVSLPNVRAAIAHLADRGVSDLSQLTLFSDGASIYECRSDDEIIDLVRGGQAVFGIFVGQVCQEVEGSLLALPGQSAEGKDIVPDGVVDELAKRRTRKTG
jgi:DNA-binding transcriptional MerR regulator